MPRPLPDVAASHPGPRRSALAELEAWQRLVICGRPEQVAVARAFVRQVLGAGHPALDRVTLLTSELVTNSVNHSDSRLGGGSITVTVRPVTVGSGSGCVRVEVTDDGAATAPVMHRDDDLAETGRGLRLVEAYSLMWDYYRDGTRTVTWFECEPEPLALRAVRHKKDLTRFLGAVLRPQGVEDAVTVRAAVGVRAEVVAQPLDEGGGQAFGAERVVVGQGGREAGHGDAEADGGGDDVAPRVLGLLKLLGEVRVGQQRGQLGVGLVGGADPVQERGPDDAAAAPDGGDAAQVDPPVVLAAADVHHVPALRVGDQLGRVQCLLDLGLLDLVGELGGLVCRLLGAGQVAGGGPQVGVAGQGPGEHRLGDAADRDAQVERVLHGPAAGALLLGLVEQDVDEWLSGSRVGVREDLGGDLDQVGVQPAGVPRFERLGGLRGRQADGVPEQVVGFGDELHVGVLDAVVHHLDEVAGAVGADVGAAGRSVDVGADRFEHGPRAW